ncbi:MarR family transcriptional regulator [Alteromonas confluentis]|nr:MarR family transcriptional regulator [Alteromonas confluentis]
MMKARIGIMSEQLIRVRAIAIAQGKYTPGKDEPKVWYTSLNGISQILNPDNIALLRLIDRERPESVTALAELSGRQKSNLSNTLKSLSDKGFLRLEKGPGRSLKPVALFTDFEIVITQEIENLLAELQQQAA